MLRQPYAGVGHGQASVVEMTKSQFDVGTPLAGGSVADNDTSTIIVEPPADCTSVTCLQSSGMTSSRTLR